MITHLYIKNYALISELDLDLSAGFSVITGETGAGKSILLGAISLLLGARADTKAIKRGETRCVIEATLTLHGSHFEAFFEQEGFDFDPDACTIRRELTAAGKSRAFINDTPATVVQLRQLGEQVVDIHSQHKNLFLAREDFQLSVLDILAANKQTLDAYKDAYRQYTALRAEYQRLREAADKDKADEDYLQFQLTQLDELDPQPDEDNTLQAELNTLQHAEEIKEALYKGGALLSEENACIDLLAQTRRILEHIAEVYAPASELAERVETCRVELKDVQAELESGAEDVEFDPARLAYVSERLGTLYTLEQKHHADTADDLIRLRATLAAQLDAITHSDERIAEAEARMNAAYDTVLTQAQLLSEQRKQSAEALKSEMESKLQTLGMPHVSFTVSLDTRPAPDATGLDRVDFRFSANKNVPPESIASIASGGEIARVMLSLKALISRATSLPTVIFDEIDTGVSGQIAERMADMMREMTAREGAQVLSITHLPQIAAAGLHHYKVYKDDLGTTTESHIIPLTPEQRVEELAHMLSGSTLTDAALQNARALLNTAPSMERGLSSPR